MVSTHRQNEPESELTDRELTHRVQIGSRITAVDNKPDKARPCSCSVADGSTSRGSTSALGHANTQMSSTSSRPKLEDQSGLKTLKRRG
eukprot:2969596-Amphidinium_carterae.1